MKSIIADLDQTLLVYQPIKEWFGHMEQKYPGPITEYCRNRLADIDIDEPLSFALQQLGITSTTALIEEAQKAVSQQ